MAEGARLESVYRFIPIEGSNPSFSAIFIHGRLNQINELHACGIRTLDENISAGLTSGFAAKNILLRQINKNARSFFGRFLFGKQYLFYNPFHFFSIKIFFYGGIKAMLLAVCHFRTSEITT